RKATDPYDTLVSTDGSPSNLMRDDTSGPDDDANLSPDDRRISVTGARRMLGLIGRNYDDDEVLEILDILYGMAELSYDTYLDQKSDQSKPPDCP
ncbi:MAG: hypothetical protein AAF479_12675, partial [Pseudomonadota bacterium]